LDRPLLPSFYMAAVSAASHNDIIREYVGSLIKRGKPFKCAIVAAMRKLLICMQSLAKNPGKY
jgi:transposase